ncbi:hypothetical protein HDU98_001107 [Podochytrium sp. JEL0797]|nr:hypothetical protein HDU98_001107 [Podochytrium sp. JEL0797]
MIFATLNTLVLSAVALQAAALPVTSTNTAGSECANFGEWDCDVTQTDLLQCAYGQHGDKLTWHVSGTSCNYWKEHHGLATDAPEIIPAPTEPAQQTTIEIFPTAIQTESTLETTEVAPVSTSAATTPAVQPPQTTTPAVQPPKTTTPAVQPPKTTTPVVQPPTTTASAPAPGPQPPTSSANILISGSGSGTYYYDIYNQVCPGFTHYAENQGITACEPSVGYQTLAQRNNNNIVAIAVDQLSANKAGLCGKRVVVKYNGEEVEGNFVVWDACVACTGGVKIDFSLGALQKIEPNACHMGVVPGMSWEVTDEQVIPYVA